MKNVCKCIHAGLIISPNKNQNKQAKEKKMIRIDILRVGEWCKQGIEWKMYKCMWCCYCWRQIGVGIFENVKNENKIVCVCVCLCIGTDFKSSADTLIARRPGQQQRHQNHKCSSSSSWDHDHHNHHCDADDLFVERKSAASRLCISFA